MSTTQESTPLAVLDEAAAGLRSAGEYRAILHADDLRVLVLAVVGDRLLEQRQVRAEVVGLRVQIESSRGTADGAIRVKSPLSATISAVITLGNDDEDATRIRLVDFQMKTESGMLAKTMMGAFNVEGRARAILADPESVLVDVLTPELRARGAELTGLGLHFENQALVAQLSGHAI